MYNRPKLDAAVDSVSTSELTRLILSLYCCLFCMIKPYVYVGFLQVFWFSPSY